MSLEQTSLDTNTNIDQTNDHNHHDYGRSLKLGLIIGVALLPTIRNLGLNSAVYPMAVFGMPLLSFLGLYLAKLLVSRIAVLWQFAKFGLIGVANTAINFGILNLLSAVTGFYSGVPVYLFGSLAFLCALANSYYWNAHWSFGETSHKTHKEFIIFFAVTLAAFLIHNQVLYTIATHVNPFWGLSSARWLNIANVAATLLTMFWSFVGFKFLVFTKKDHAV